MYGQYKIYRCGNEMASEKKHWAEEFPGVESRRTTFGGDIGVVVKSGKAIESKIGIYACDTECFTTFRDVFQEAMKKVTEGIKNATIDPNNPMYIRSKELKGDESLLKDYVVTSRVRLARNLTNYPYASLINKEQRNALEAEVSARLASLDSLKDTAKEGRDYGGVYTKLGDVNVAEWEKQGTSRFLFGNEDRYQIAAGMYGEFPEGRGVFISRDKSVIVWLNEEDHLRIQCMRKSADLRDVFDTELKVLNHLGQEISFACDDEFGWLTSCPTNLGIGMRASVHINLPNIKKAFTIDQLKEFCAELKLEVRGIGGENTGYEGNVFDISNRQRTYKDKPADVIETIIRGISLLAAIEKSLDSSVPSKHWAEEFSGVESRKTKFGGDIGVIVKSGKAIESKVGIYACDTECFTTFRDVFQEAMKKVTEGIKNATIDPNNPMYIRSKELKGDESLLKDYVVTSRVRLARNLTNYPYASLISREQRNALEAEVSARLASLDSLKDDAKEGRDYGGVYTKLGDANVAEWEKQGISRFLFGNEDRYQIAAGMYGEFPEGRGVFISRDRSVIVWLNEEDHLRIQCMRKSPDLRDVFDTELKVLNHLGQEISFACDDEFGWLTSCPTNLGIGMRASVHINLANIKKAYTIDQLKEFCAELKLEVRGIGGENTGYAGNIFDISNRQRTYKDKPADVIETIIRGISLLAAIEKSLEAENKHWAEEFAGVETRKTKFGGDIGVIVKSGKAIESKVGIYACDTECFTTFRDVFQEAMKKVTEGIKNATIDPNNPMYIRSKELKGDEGLLKKYVVTSRVRLARNLTNYPYASLINKEQRNALEAEVSARLASLDSLKDDAKEGRDYGGVYTKLGDVNVAEWEKQGTSRFLFGNEDRYQIAAGMYGEFPEGRGVFISRDKSVIVWLNEEDHLRIQCMRKSPDLRDVFDTELKVLNHLGQEISFACDDEFGWLTSCPTNLGIGMRASVHINLANIKKAYTIDQLKEFCAELKLEVRGIGGENTGYAGNIFDISNRQRTYKDKPADVIETIIRGISLLAAIENSLEAENKHWAEEFSGVETRKTKFGGDIGVIVKSGKAIESKVGIYACDTECFTTFRDVFQEAMKKVTEGIKNATIDPNNPMYIRSKELKGDEGLLKDYVVTSRVRLARNLTNYPYASLINKEQRNALEAEVSARLASLDSLKDDAKEGRDYGGVYTKLGDVNVAEWEKQGISRFLFGNEDRYQIAAGMYGEFPEGRGVFISRDRSVIVWLNEEDHLRIQCMRKSPDLRDVFDTELKVLNHLGQEISFACDDEFGWLTSCPTNLGIGMRASVHINLANIKKAYTIDQLKEFCAELKLEVRGIGGENTGYEGNVFDISNRQRTYKDKPADVIETIIRGISLLAAIEKSLEAENKHWAEEFAGVDTRKTKFGGDIGVIVKSGKAIESKVGIYACDTECFTTFRDVFQEAMKKVTEGIKNATIDPNNPMYIRSKDLKGDEGLLKKYVVTSRVRLARNLTNYPYASLINKEQRNALEAEVSARLASLDSLKDDAKEGRDYGGVYTKLGDVNVAEWEKQGISRFLFGNEDRYQIAAGMYGEFPEGRGVFISRDRSVIVWLNEEDHLRIQCMRKSPDLRDVFDTELKVLNHLGQEISFACDDEFGWLTSCPTNLGIGMRASVHINLANIKKAFTIDQLKEFCAELKLEVRGIGGENTGYAGNIFDISNRQRTYKDKPADVIETIIRGISLLAAIENSLESENKHWAEEFPSVETRKTKFGGDIGVIVKSGKAIESKVGIYACDTECFTTFRDVFQEAMKKVTEGIKNATIDPNNPMYIRSKELKGDEGLLKDYVVTSRVRLARNLTNYPYASLINKEQRNALEAEVSARLASLDSLKDDAKEGRDYGGVYTKLGDVNVAEWEKQGISRFLFGNEDRYQIAAGMYGEFPEGRGVFISRDRSVIVWLNEEDHLRIQCMRKSPDLRDVFDTELKVLNHLGQEISFACDDEFGWLTSCPTNLGIGMRASVHINLANIKKAYTIDQLKEFCAELKLEVRGIGGENTGYEGNVFDISNRQRTYKDKPADVIETIIRGISLLAAIEKSLA